MDISSYFIKNRHHCAHHHEELGRDHENAMGDVLTDKPLVVLVNGNTKSSAEAIARR